MSRISNALVGWWKLDDNAASATVVDARGSHDGDYMDGAGSTQNTSTGASIGKLMGALDFDDANTEFVEIADHADWDIISQITIAIWAKDDLSDIPSAPPPPKIHVLLSKAEVGTPANEWMIRLISSEKLEIILSGDGAFGAGADAFQWRSTDAVVIEKWHFYAFTFNSGSLAAYLDGEVFAGSNLLGNETATIHNSTTPILIGAQFKDAVPTYDRYFDGLLDNAMIFNRALSIAEIRQVYNEGRGVHTLSEMDETVRLTRGRERYY